MVPGVIMPNHTFNAIVSVGFRDKCSTIVSVPKQGEILDFGFMSMFPQYCYDKYSWMFPTIFDVNKATLRYDNNLSIEYDGDFGETFKLLLELFAPLVDQCDILEPHEVKINPKSAGGPSFEYTGMKYGDLLTRYYSEFALCWEFAHQVDAPMYWKASGKTELLPTRKVEDGDARTFMFPDGPHRFSGQRMTQNFNERMGALPSHWSRIGFDRTHGGFTGLAKEFVDKYQHFFEGDLKKWDARMCAFLLYICCMLRWCCYKPHLRIINNWNRLVYQYKNKIKTLIFLPTGQLMYLLEGNKSGQDSTSYDNTIGHSFIFLHEARKELIAMDIEPTLVNIQKHLGLGLYGDDSLGGLSSDFYNHITKTRTIPQFLNTMYTKWGMIFKQDECKVQETIIGLKFIGGIFKQTSYGIVHTFSIDRAMSAMTKQHGSYTRDALWSKYTALLALMTFEEPRHAIRTWMRKTQKEWGTNLWIPSDYELHAFWLGWESPLPPIDLSHILSSWVA